MSAPDLAFAQRVLAAQPLNALLGARLTAFGGGEAVLELAIDERHHQQDGLVHGGVLAYCADNALTFAAGSVLGADILTTDVTVRYHHAARSGRLRTRAVVDHADERVAVCSARLEIVDSAGDVALCALAHGSARVSRPKADRPATD